MEMDYRGGNENGCWSHADQRTLASAKNLKPNASAEDEEFGAPVEMSKKEKRRQDLLERLSKLQRDFTENKEKWGFEGDWATASSR